jgi:hypothetical protein
LTDLNVKHPSKTLGVKIPALRVITFKLQDPKKSMLDITPLYVQISLDGHAEKVRNATRLKNGTLLLEVFKEKQAEAVRKVNLLRFHLVHVERHSPSVPSEEI